MSGRPGERGAALVVTLVFATAMAAAAVAFVGARRSDGLATRAQVQAVEAEAMLQSALQQTAAILANRTGRQIVPPQLAWRFGATEVTVRIEAEAGKVDLNAAEEPLLQGLLLALNLDDERAQAFAQTALDWRDENPTRRTAGAEDRDYDLDANGASGAADRPFAHPAEIRYLPGVDPALWGRLAPLVTVYAGSATPNRTQASATVRRALAIAQGLASDSEAQEDAGAGEGADAPEEADSGREPGYADRASATFARGAAGAPGTPRAAGAGARPAGAGSRFTQEPGRLAGGGAGTGLTRRGTEEAELGEAAPGEEEAGEGGAATGTGVQTLYLDVRFPSGYEAAARAVVAFGQEAGRDRPFTVLDWAPILREQGALP